MKSNSRIIGHFPWQLFISYTILISLTCCAPEFKINKKTLLKKFPCAYQYAQNLSEYQAIKNLSPNYFSFVNIDKTEFPDTISGPVFKLTYKKYFIDDVSTQTFTQDNRTINAIKTTYTIRTITPRKSPDPDVYYDEFYNLKKIRHITIAEADSIRAALLLIMVYDESNRMVVPCIRRNLVTSYDSCVVLGSIYRLSKVWVEDHKLK